MMNWNEPGNKGENPWGNRGNDPFEELKKLLNSLFNKKSGNGEGGEGGDNGASNLPIKSLVTGIIIILGLGWLASGLYKVEDAERGVVIRFGQYLKETGAGLNWHVPYPIETVELVNVSLVRTIQIGFRANRGKVLSESLMLTQDENIIDVQLEVQYQISSARDFLFNVSQPIATLQQVVESVLREVVGQSLMDFVLTDGRSEVAERVKSLAQEALDQFAIGLTITNVNMQNAQAPEQVQAAFDDAVKAREDKERIINEAQAYSNKILPQARGEAARMTEEATAYKERVIAEAKGQTERFDKLYKEYIKAPKVTRDRMYLDTMESVMQKSNKIILDTKGNNSLMYLPIDKLIPQGFSQPRENNSNVNSAGQNLDNNYRQRNTLGARTR
jgi:membrane protease subunit HflK